MPRSRSKPKTTEKQPVEQGRYYTYADAEWGGFINLKLTAEDLASFDLWFAATSARHGQQLDDLLGEGMKFGLSYDRENQSYVATLTGSPTGSPTMRSVMTSRAGTVNEVIGLTLWKFLMYCDGTWENYHPATRQVDRRG